MTKGEGSCPHLPKQTFFPPIPYTIIKPHLDPGGTPKTQKARLPSSVNTHINLCVSERVHARTHVPHSTRALPVGT